ncbi:hypothetical protein [Amycolatopsis albispora]|uniref:Secreted protein n=1 Tax=Amycolatopsis albispora TaxID=1804986 RepID=A0A344KZK4_9PSEU|nr:hypothetical protein [Amycolatopsis albispora]AXB41228.1 hypothetical protein A4R43_00775 [Amycolatopsis albispora]
MKRKILAGALAMSTALLVAAPAQATEPPPPAEQEAGTRGVAECTDYLEAYGIEIGFPEVTACYAGSTGTATGLGACYVGLRAVEVKRRIALAACALAAL